MVDISPAPQILSPVSGPLLFFLVDQPTITLSASSRYFLASESTSDAAAKSSSSSGTGSYEAGDFECNICFELAQDLVVTLCSHLYCWPCLYRWLLHHSNCHECPVCKVLILEETLVPLYGREKTQTDPRSKSYPGNDVPHHLNGQRPETAGIPSPGMNQFPSFGFGLLGGFMLMAYAGMENFDIFMAFGGLIPALFNVQFHGFQDAAAYGTSPGYPFGFNTYPSGRNSGGIQQPGTGGQQEDNGLKKFLMMIGIFVVLAVLCW